MAGTLVVGVSYVIQTLGTTDFTLVGAASNNVGISFVATGLGAGTGAVVPCTIVNAGSFINGTSYTITYVGTTDYTLIGAASNTFGLTFTATGPGLGTGTAIVLLNSAQVIASEGGWGDSSVSFTPNETNAWNRNYLIRYDATNSSTLGARFHDALTYDNNNTTPRSRYPGLVRAGF